MNDHPDSRQPRSDGADRSILQNLIQWIRGRSRQRNGESTLRDTLEELMEEHARDETSINPDERILLTNILNLRNITVSDIMVPRADIVAIEYNTSLSELVARMSTEAHSRLPVYRKTLDDVVGMVHMKDVLAWCGSKKRFRLSGILRRVLFAAPSTPVLDLLLEMRQTRIHMALVVDEFGGIDGMVTIEDLVEEIVGEIEDEHSTEERPTLIERPDGTFEASARTQIEDFEARVGPVLSAEERAEIDTLGGLVAALAGRVPGRGQVIRHGSGVEFEVLDADPRRVKRLRVRMPAPPPRSAEPAASGGPGSSG